MDPITITTPADAQTALGVTQAQLTALGFKVVPDADGWSGIADVGSAVGRALGGGFVRRMKVTWAVATAPTGASVVTVTPAMSGYGGGAMGRSKAKKEMDAIGQALAANLPPA